MAALTAERMEGKKVEKKGDLLVAWRVAMKVVVTVVLKVAMKVAEMVDSKELQKVVK